MIRAVLLCLLPLLGTVSLAAASSTAGSDGEATRKRSKVEVLRLAPGEAPKIDGHVQEELWTRAALAGALTQVSPIPGAEPSQSTDVRLAYDQDKLYVSIICYDDPAEVRARQADRDARVEYDDVVELWFDTFNDQRSAFWFQITPGGSRGDALISDAGNRFNKQWDGIWYGRSQVTERGWEAELALPFKTLAFDPDSSTWGFNINRKRVASGESMRWASPDPAYRFFSLTEGGQLTGLRGMNQGVGLDVVPYVKTSLDREGSSEHPTWHGDVGLDISWRPSPSSTLRATINTDFAETEVDSRRINLSRFPLFFPEKRDFFLEDAGLFEFGSPTNRRSLVPFFSRTIGRDEDGAALPILGGVKYTGRHGRWNVGVLDVSVDSTDTLPGRNLAVARATYDLGGESAVGVLATEGTPGQGDGASTLGLDLRLGDSRFFGPGHSGSLWAWGLDTHTAGEGGDGSAYGVEAQSRNSTWDVSGLAQRVEEGFDPALGFVRRTGVDRTRVQTQHTWRSEDPAAIVRSWDSRIAVDVERDLVGNEDSWAIPLRPGRLTFASNDRLEYEIHHIHETLDDGFELGNQNVPGPRVRPGEFDMLRHFIEYEAATSRRVLGEVELEYGDYYGGTLRRLSVRPVIVPGRSFTFSGGYTDVEARLDTGTYHTQLISADFKVTAGPDLVWKNLLQYDTESKQLGFQTRMRWILTPGQDLFLVGLFGWEKAAHERSFQSESQEVAFKLTYTLRF
ncbi:MAG: hypothetical protein ACI8QC_002775 [Planctomycetota bacterium]|jgi:hypothetical protein